MPTLTPEQIAGLIKYYSVGGPSPIAPVTDDNAIKAIAICLAESGGDTDARGGPNANGSYDWGLWQINDIHNPTQRIKTSGAANWLEAWRIAAMGTSWSPWSSYKSQQGKPPAYLAHMDTAKQAWSVAKPATVGGEASGSGTAPTYTQFEGPLSFLNPLMEPGVWTRVAMMIVGGLLLLLVAASLLKKTSLTNALPIGRALNIAKAAKKGAE